jgi:Zn-dependent protease
MSADAGPQAPPPPPPAMRPGGIRLGRVLGVPIYLRSSWLILAVIVVWLYGPVAERMLPQLSTAGAYSLAVVFVLCLLLSVLLHELGHAVTARHYGIGVRAITLELLGGYTEMESDSPSARSDLFVSLVGPLVSGVLGLAALFAEIVLPDGTIADQLAFQLAWSNLIVAVFNALPGLPLDGGRALRAAVWGITGNRHVGSQVAGWIGRVVSVGTLVVGLLLFSAGYVSLISAAFAAIVALTLWQGATAAIMQGRIASRLPRINLRQLARPVFTVSTGTPLAEAARRATEAGRPGAQIAVADASGRVVALVQEDAATAVPAERRPWIAVESVARTLDRGRTLAADLAGDDVIRAVQANPAPSYLVVSGEDGQDVVGVLRTADLARLLNS